MGEAPFSDFGQYFTNAMKIGIADPAPIHRDAGELAANFKAQHTLDTYCVWGRTVRQPVELWTVMPL
jgi:hypothetical protein